VAGALAVAPARLEEFARDHTPPPLAWEPDLAEVIYVDSYGNLITGIRAANIDEATVFRLGDQSIQFGNTFSAVAENSLLWYRNSLDLVEVAENCGSAAHRLGAAVGTRVMRVSP
jgi:S-adenosylmethionine hydrolase